MASHRPHQGQAACRCWLALSAQSAHLLVGWAELCPYGQTRNAGALQKLYRNMKLTEENVHELARITQPARDGYLSPGEVQQAGVFIGFSINKAALEGQRLNVESMLKDLPSGLEKPEGLPIARFHEAKAGKYLGQFWTAETKYVEVFVAHARALGLIEPTRPREEWTPENMAAFRYTKQEVAKAA